MALNDKGVREAHIDDADNAMAKVMSYQRKDAVESYSTATKSTHDCGTSPDKVNDTTYVDCNGGYCKNMRILFNGKYSHSLEQEIKILVAIFKTCSQRSLRA